MIDRTDFDRLGQVQLSAERFNFPPITIPTLRSYSSLFLCLYALRSSNLFSCGGSSLEGVSEIIRQCVGACSSVGQTSQTLSFRCSHDVLNLSRHAADGCDPDCCCTPITKKVKFQLGRDRIYVRPGELQSLCMRLRSSSIAFGDSYSYVQGTHGLQNYSFIGDLQNFSFNAEDLLTDQIVQNQVSL